jgi:hypothetical protein
MKTLPGVVLALVLLFAGGLIAKQWFPTVVEVPGVPIIHTDTIRIEHFNLDTIIEYRDRVITDTVTLTHQVVLSDPVLIPCPDLPRIRGITRLTAGQGFDDTTYVSIVDLEATGREIAVQRSVEKLYTPGPLLYAEPGRYDFGTWPQVEPECGFWCQARWLLIGAAGGALAWELARE